MMSDQGRGSASMKKMISVLLVCLLVLGAEHGINAETHIVGGPKKWTFNVKTWPNGISFSAGDVLVFKYNSKQHNVVAVDKSGYDSCKTPAGAQVFSSGTDEITVGSGENYFICNFPGHCQAGMKIAITAA